MTGEGQPRPVRHKSFIRTNGGYLACAQCELDGPHGQDGDRGEQVAAQDDLALEAGLAVFVLLNFPSSGASVQGPMLPTFWHVLNRFWIGASASDAFRSIVYFGGRGVGTDMLKLLGWLAVGVVLLTLGWFKLQHGRQEVTSAERSAAQLRTDSARADQACRVRPAEIAATEGPEQSLPNP